ncbi:restriction endonuclease subunit S [Winogradskyella sp. DF17]|uniref:Restriction endonuclease subunit S n=1 Tax=Winogradskyella pelagia TaxID=2819984 RepID=A0ABS3T4Y8_9FLAO|nr:restriction endonuclease subunit S [Winogradskyella sp. DF17]MBO3117499.1 restriction endonuclease subunit S [Winogradskyella sp. DF17]
MPKNWKTYNLGDLVDLKQGLAINKKTKHLLTEDTSELPLFKINDLINNTVKHYVKSDEVPKQCIAKEDELIYTRTGQVGLIFKGKKGCIHNNCFKIIPNENLLSKDYIYWFLRQPHIIEYANNIASGSVQKDLNHKAFKSIEIDLPDTLYEQKAIASILSAIDDKIENNLAINKTLEDMAMALYKHWFVDFGPFQDSEFIDSELGPIPKGWEVKRLADCNKLVLGGTPARKNESFWENGTIGWLNSGKVNEFRIVEPTSMITLEAVSKSSTKLMKAGTTVIAITGATLGQISRIEKEFCANQSVIGVLGNEIFSDEFIYLWMHQAMDELIKQSTGGAQQHVNKNDVGELNIVEPSVKVKAEFQKEIIDLFETIKLNCFENQTLTQLRDTLLPNLISGEVRLKEFQNQIETVL